MKKFNTKLIIGIFITLSAAVFVNSVNLYAATSPNLGSAGSYSVLGHTTVTNTGATTMPGDLGISIGGAPVGFPPGVVGTPGTIRNAGDSLAAQNANTAAFLALSAVPNVACTADYSGTGTIDLTTISPLVPGVYCADAFILTGNLTLTGSSGVWIFRSAATIITSPASSISGGDPCNVWWKAVSSVTLDTTTSFMGNILAQESITINNRATLNGRALAQNGAVTLDSNTITGSTCLTTPVFINNITPKLPNTGLQPKSDGLNTIMIIITTLTLLALLFIQKLRPTNS